MSNAASPKPEFEQSAAAQRADDFFDFMEAGGRFRSVTLPAYPNSGDVLTIREYRLTAEQDAEVDRRLHSEPASKEDWEKYYACGERSDLLRGLKEDRIIQEVLNPPPPEASVTKPSLLERICAPFGS